MVQGDCAGSDSPIPRSGAKNSVASCRVVCGAIDVDNMEPPNSLPTFRFREIFQHTGSILELVNVLKCLLNLLIIQANIKVGRNALFLIFSPAECSRLSKNGINLPAGWHE